MTTMRTDRQRRGPQILARLAVPTFFLLFCIGYFLDVRGMRGDAAGYPRALVALIVVLLVIVSANELRQWRAARRLEDAGPHPDTEVAETDEDVPVLDTRKLLIARVLTVVAHLGLILLMPLIGTVITASVFAGALAFALGERRWFVLILLPLAVGLVLHFGFIEALGVPLP